MFVWNRHPVLPWWIKGSATVCADTRKAALASFQKAPAASTRQAHEVFLGSQHLYDALLSRGSHTVRARRDNAGKERRNPCQAFHYYYMTSFYMCEGQTQWGVLSLPTRAKAKGVNTSQSASPEGKSQPILTFQPISNQSRDDLRWSMRWNIIRIVIQYSMIYAEMRNRVIVKRL